MKKSILLAASLLALNLTPVWGQILNTFAFGNQQTLEATNLTKFNLDFPGGTPAELVKSIEKATGKPLNAIIPTEDTGIPLPPLKMNDVLTPQLFAAVEAASRKTVTVQNSGPLSGSYSPVNTDFGFRTADNPISDSSIWYFYADKPPLPLGISTEKACRFYNLDPYLNRGFTVDDITTAIQTGWKMYGVSPVPQLNYHKETKLLIAYGEPDKLASIESVLRTLPQGAGTSMDMQNVWSELMKMNSRMTELRQKMDQLTKTNFAPGALPEEKSGK